MSSAKNQQQARRRAEIIFKVRSGVLTVREGARRLGVSPKTYYKWEQRGLAAMLGALENRSPGRPAVPGNPEREAFEQQLQELQQQMLLTEERHRILTLLDKDDPWPDDPAKKK